MKKVLIGLTLSFSVLFAAQVFAGENIKLNIDNVPVEADISPQIIDGRTMVPVRAIFEALGADVKWDKDTKTITGNKGNTNVIMTIESNTAIVNGKEVTMDCAPVIIEGRTLVPARYAAEFLGCEVEWNSTEKTVNIVSAIKSKESTTFETTEMSSETTTLETTTNPMLSYDTYYKPGTYTVGNDIPAGEYVVFANPNKIGYLYKYARDGNVDQTSGKRYIYSKYFNYCDIIRLESGNYVDLSNAYAVPSEKAEKLDASQNGTFRAGKDVKSGHLTFKLNPSSTIGYVDVGLPDAKAVDRTVQYLTPDDSSVTVNVVSGMYIKIFACDILDEHLSPIYTHSEIEEKSDIDLKYNFAEITPAFKKTVDDHLTMLVNDLTPKSFKATKYTKTYANKITDEWTASAKTSADKKYAAIAKEIYTSIRVYANDTNGDAASASTILLNGKNISGAEYKDILKYEKDYISGAITAFKNSSSFAAAEKANKTLYYFRFDVPRVNGRKVN